jgi:hypothetical protein
MGAAIFLRAPLQQGCGDSVAPGLAMINADSTNQSDRHRMVLSVRFFCFLDVRILAQQIHPIPDFVFGACRSGRHSDLFG